MSIYGAAKDAANVLKEAGKMILTVGTEFGI